MAFRLQPMRIPFAVGAGAAVGASVVTVAFSLPGLTDAASQTIALAMMPAIFIAALIVWGVGIVVIGGPAWVVLHDRGRVAPANALSLGLAATFTAAVLLNLLLQTGMIDQMQDGHAMIADGRRTAYGWFSLLKDSVLLALLGGGVATVIWRIAYRTER